MESEGKKSHESLHPKVRSQAGHGLLSQPMPNENELGKAVIERARL